VVGIDVIPALPPRGVSALQGDFLSESVQELVRDFVREWKNEGGIEGEGEGLVERVKGDGVGEGEVDAGEEREGGRVVQKETGPVAAEDGETATTTTTPKAKSEKKTKKSNAQAALDLQQGRVVDVVLSDMCAPFPGLEFGSWSNSVNRPYRRMMNTSGNPFRDHAGSIVSLESCPFFLLPFLLQFQFIPVHHSSTIHK
jgi:21S rRNA (uridine2791-2'-O)-methyltransferase